MEQAPSNRPQAKAPVDHGAWLQLREVHKTLSEAIATAKPVIDAEVDNPARRILGIESAEMLSEIVDKLDSVIISAPGQVRTKLRRQLHQLSLDLDW